MPFFIYFWYFSIQEFSYQAISEVTAAVVVIAAPPISAVPVAPTIVAEDPPTITEPAAPAIFSNVLNLFNTFSLNTSSISLKVKTSFKSIFLFVIVPLISLSDKPVPNITSLFLPSK